jgi:hypothetical protein
MIFDDYWQDNVYSFNQKLVASKGIVESCDVHEILLLRLPGCVDANQTDSDVDRTGVDWLATLSSGRTVGVDVKIREKDCMKFGNDDVALETWSVVGLQVGWTRDESKVCEWVLWVWKDTGRFFLVPFLPLCSVFSKNWHEWRDTYKPRTQKTTRKHRSWQSECVFVPRKVVVDAISNWYGGDLF